MTANEMFRWAGYTEEFENKNFIQYLNPVEKKEILFRKRTKTVELYKFDRPMFRTTKNGNKALNLDETEYHLVLKKKEELDWL